MHIKRLPIQKENLRALCLVNLWAGSGKRLFMKCFLEDHGYNNILTKSLFSSSGQPPRDRAIFPFLKIKLLLWLLFCQLFFRQLFSRKSDGFVYEKRIFGR